MRTEPLFFKKQGMFKSPCYTQPLCVAKFLFFRKNMGKIETTIFVDWENLLSDLKAIQETDAFKRA